MSLKISVNGVLAAVALSLFFASGAVATSGSSGGRAGNAGEMKPWDCSLTPCGTGGNGACASDKYRCCCPAGSPPVWTASCKGTVDCDGQSNCPLCQ